MKAWALPGTPVSEQKVSLKSHSLFLNINFYGKFGRLLELPKKYSFLSKFIDI